MLGLFTRACGRGCWKGVLSELRPNGDLRRLMPKELDEKVGRVSRRPPVGVVDPLSTNVGSDFGCQAHQKPTKSPPKAHQEPTRRLGVALLQGEDVLEWVYDPFDELPLAWRS